MTFLVGIWISAPVAGLRSVCELGLDENSFPMPGSGKDPIFVVLMMAS